MAPREGAGPRPKAEPGATGEAGAPGPGAAPRAAPGIDPLIGRTFGEFVVRELLSSGGFGMVYRAEQTALAREAVIKVLHTRHRTSDTIAQRFLREAQLASRLDHPYAAHIYAFGAEPDGVLWIAMELVRGTPLDRMLEAHGPIALERLVPLVERLGEVIHTAHEQGIVHRDLKPANVMVLARAGRLLPKLLDLGIAKTGNEPAPVRRAAVVHEVDTSLDATAPAASDRRASSGDRLTEQGSAMGTPIYMAPEQWRDASAADARTDQYALGVLCFEALTGRPPFGGTSRMAIALAHAKEPVPSLGDGFPPALDAVLARALAKQPSDRFASVLELAAAFRAASGVAVEDAGLPKLPEAVRLRVLTSSPEPIAAAVAALDGARNAHQARDAVWQLARASVRLVAIASLAAHAQIGGAPRTSFLGDELRRLRRRALTDGEWLDLSRALCRPFVSIKDAHPIPELVALAGGGAGALRALIAMRDEEVTTDEQVRELLARAMPLVAAALDELAFLDAYPLVVTRDGGADAWMGVRGRARAHVAIRGRSLPPGQVAFADDSGAIAIALSPFAAVAAPSPGAADELFLLEGHGKTGARMIALPGAFERDDAAPWEALGELVGDSADSSAASTADETCPFPGLAAFGRDDAARFVGREREVEAFVNRLRVQPLCTVVGPSGAGKSSFVQAGVIPSLPDGWTAITMRPGPSPMASLTSRLASRPARGTFVLVVDQLEELFTLCDDAGERARFADAIARLARTADDPVRVVFTIRDDFLLRAEAMPAWRARIAHGLTLVTTPAPDDLRRILVEPLRRAGYELDDPALADEIVRAIADAPGALALLSFTASRLWELRDRRFRQLSRKAYASIGGVGGALAQHAEATLTAMPADDQRLVREAFRHLVTAEGTRAVLSRDELAQILAREMAPRRGAGPRPKAEPSATGEAGARGPGVAPRAAPGIVVELLVEARLVVVSEGAGERVEIAHEALLDAWPRLVTWRREDAEGARLRDQLRAAARQWEDRGRPTGLLWRGDALAEYRMWRMRTAGALTTVEEAFADASLADARRTRRRRTGAMAIAFAALASGVIALLFSNAAANRQRARAEDYATQLHDTLEQQYEAQGRRLVLDGDPLQGLAYLARAASFGAKGRAHDFLVGEAVAAASGERVELAHDGPVRSPRFSHDGRRLVTASYDHRARIWDAQSGALVHALAHQDVVLDASFAPDDASVVTASADGTAAIWDTSTGAQRAVLAHGGSVRCAAWSPDGARVLTASADDTIGVWDAKSGARLVTARGDGAGWSACAYSPDGARVAAGDERGTTRIFDASTGRVIAVAHQRQLVRPIRFSPDGRVLVAASRDGTAIAVEVETGRTLYTFAHDASIMWAEISPDGRRVATASNDHTAAIWDLATGERLQTLIGHAAGVNRARFDASGTRLLTVSDDGTARLWDVATGRPLARWLGHRDVISDADLDPSGRQFASASDDGRAIVWDATPQERVTWLVGHTGVVDSAAFSADGTRVVTAGHDGTARIFAADGRALAILRGHDGAVRWAAFAPDARTIATAGDDGTVRLWSGTGDALAILRGHTGAVNQLAWAPDGAQLASASDDGTLRVWTAQGALVRTIRAHGGFQVRAVTYTPDGATIATTGDDGTTRTWDAATGAPRTSLPDPDLPGAVRFDPSGARGASPVSQAVKIFDARTGAVEVQLVGHVGQVTAPVAAWSPDGDLYVSGALDGTARVWDPRTGDLLAVYPHARQVWSAGFSPDGTRILTSADDGTVAIRELPRDAAPGELARLLRCRVPFALDGDRIVPRQPPACTR
ncbi:MAG TPA: protein kinase [Kofleriaceae bacterium]|nr:protein kinase [Kofleriaceae bacterium]